MASLSLKFIPPQIPTMVEAPPAGPEWLHEVKFDGYRSQLIIDADDIRIFTRRGHDWTIRYRLLVDAAAQLHAGHAIIDGEVVVTDEHGRSDFAALRSAMTTAPERLAFVAFDLLHLDGKDLRQQQLAVRRSQLADLLDGVTGPIQFSQAIEGEASAIYRAVEAAGLEGMVSKRADSVYRSGVGRGWLKVKCYEEAEMEVIGFLRQRGTAPQAYLARPDGKRAYAGGAFVALDRESRDAFWKRAESLAGEKAPKGIKRKDAQWLRPGLVGRVRFLKGEEQLRHATLREVWGDGLE